MYISAGSPVCVGEGYSEELEVKVSLSSLNRLRNVSGGAWEELIVLGFNMSTLVGHFVCHLPDKGRKEIVQEMKERDREKRGTEVKLKKQKN